MSFCHVFIDHKFLYAIKLRAAYKMRPFKKSYLDWLDSV